MGNKLMNKKHQEKQETTQSITKQNHGDWTKMKD